MKIGTPATRTGTSVPTIRYYESIGLLPRPSRREGGQRTCTDRDVQRLTFIRRCREFGFPIDQVRSLNTLGRDRSRSCMQLRDAAATHLAIVRVRIRELNALAADLERFVKVCDGTCAGGPRPDCTILGDLAAGHPWWTCPSRAPRLVRARLDESSARMSARRTAAARSA